MANHLQAIPDGRRRSGTLLDEIRYESDDLLSRMCRSLRKEPLLLAMLLAVVAGSAGGSLARALHPSGRAIELLGTTCPTDMPGVRLTAAVLLGPAARL
ncbi:hypothetical protein ABBQ32_002540 [Trebouxia sp. C0010 RCD-2024]